MNQHSFAASKDGDPPRLNPNMLGYIRAADMDERLPERLEDMIGLKMRGGTTTEAEHPFRGWFTEVGGVMMGVNRNAQDPIHAWERALHRHLERVALGTAPVGGRVPIAITGLHADLLRYDGFSPEGIAAVGCALGRIAVDHGERRHVLTAWIGRQPSPSATTRKAAARDMPTSWDKIQIDLGSGVVATAAGIVVRTRLPETLIRALPGRTADAVVGHPALARHVIRSVAVRKKSLTLKVEPA